MPRSRQQSKDQEAQGLARLKDLQRQAAKTKTAQKERFSDGLQDGLEFERAADGLHRPVTAPDPPIQDRDPAPSQGVPPQRQQPPRPETAPSESPSSAVRARPNRARPVKAPPPRKIQKAYTQNLEKLIPRRRPAALTMPWDRPFRQESWFNLFETIEQGADRHLTQADRQLAKGQSGLIVLMIFRLLPYLCLGFLTVYHIVGLFWLLGWVPNADGSFWLWGAFWMSIVALPIDIITLWRLSQEEPLELPWWFEEKIKRKWPYFLKKWPSYAYILQQIGVFYFPLHLCFAFFVLLILGFPWLYTFIGGYR